MVYKTSMIDVFKEIKVDSKSMTKKWKLIKKLTGRFEKQPNRTSRN